ncbi:MAG TPA: M20/M25/M40 family metallo-hydrolase [Baekduia sp.]|uniref:M20/M25/M40 family metallo-hydrolase n=1 Tax=Baekduia sp. TaxID=2600305 RepID=UPI002D765C9E|nr:M20/M25/M40 family metallo-hydrolase [Baekduia sp.]HET6507234.1 M20/M25/M40 family metallo-hydrolase [Baekduia sp.]
MNDAEAAADRAVADARRICAVEAPPFAEGPRGELVAALLAEAGAPVVDTDAVGNVIARFGPGDAPPVVFAAHLDTVFAAGTEIAFRRDGDRLAAPGIGDNALGVAALLHLARHLRDHPPRRPLWLVATVGEEGLGDLRGAKALVAEHAPAAFVAVEGTMLDAIAVGAVGSLRFRVTVLGPGGHSWADRGAPSAVHALVAMLAAALDALPTDRDDVAFNVGTIEGGTTVNAIAAEASAVIDLRCGDDADLRALADDLRRALRADGVAVEVEQLGHRPGGALAAGHPLPACARRARERAGLPVALETASSTDANAAYGAGVPAITVGVSTGGNAHRLDEYLDLPPIAGGLRALTALADEIDATDF